MRLIDTDAIKLPEGFFEKVDNVPKFYDWLNSLPTIDAVPVVRCKDCQFFSDITDFTGKCDVRRDYIFTTDFCSYAVWRNDDKRAKY